MKGGLGVSENGCAEMSWGQVIGLLFKECGYGFILFCVCVLNSVVRDSSEAYIQQKNTL